MGTTRTGGMVLALDDDERLSIVVDSLSRKGRIFTHCCAILTLALAGVLGMLGPSKMVDINPVNDLGKDIALTDVTARSMCNSGPSDDENQVGKIKYCWAHRFRFEGELRPELFRLDMITKSKRFTDKDELEIVHKFTQSGRFAEVTEYELNLLLTLYGISGSKTELISEELVTRTIVCPTTDSMCSRISLVEESKVEYDAYWVAVKIPDNHVQQAREFIETVTFTFSIENSDFDNFQICLKYTCCGINLLMLLLWWYICDSSNARAHGETSLAKYENVVDKRPALSWLCKPYATVEQRWILALLIGLFWFNYPLYGYEFMENKAVVKTFTLIEVIGQFTFMSILCLYWLVSFDVLRHPDPYSIGFYMPKILFVTLFWTLGIGIYCIIAVRRIDDPFYSWYENSLHHRVAVAYLSFFGGIFGVWMAVLFIRALTILVNVSKGVQFLYYCHTVRIILTVVLALLKSIFHDGYNSALESLLIHVFFTQYIAELLFLFTPRTISRAPTINPNLDLDDGGFMDIPALPSFRIHRIRDAVGSDDEEASTMDRDAKSVAPPLIDINFDDEIPTQNLEKFSPHSSPARF